MRCEITGIVADDLPKLITKYQKEIVKLKEANNLMINAYDLLKDNPECEKCGTTEFLCGCNKRD